MDSHLLQIIVEYRYWILIPLSFVEGPLVAFFAGTLAASGYFNVVTLGIFFLVRDVLVDLGCYGLGYWGSRAPWMHKLLRRMGVTEDHLDEVRALWQTHPGKTMFLSKLSYGVAAGFIVVAGLVKMSLRKFMLFGVIVTFLHYGTLLVLGYFLGASFGGTIVGILEKIPYVLFVLSIFAVGYYFFKRSVSRKLAEAEQKVHEEAGL